MDFFHETPFSLETGLDQIIVDSQYPDFSSSPHQSSSDQEIPEFTTLLSSSPEHLPQTDSIIPMMDLPSDFLNLSQISETSSPSSLTPPSSQTLSSGSSPIHPMAIPVPQEVQSLLEKPKSKRGRKKRIIDPNDTDISAVQRTVDDIRKISSEDFELEVQRIVLEKGGLTPAEDQEIKRQRRLIKNRESAQLSRSRKKGEVDQLEGRVRSLEVENDGLKRKIVDLTNENSVLRTEVTRLTHILKKTGVSFASNLQIGPAKESPTIKSTTLMFMFVLFGLFLTQYGGFHIFGPPQNGIISSALVPYNPYTPRVYDVNQFGGFGRGLKEYDEEPVQSQILVDYSPSSPELPTLSAQESAIPPSENRALEADSCNNQAACWQNNNNNNNNGWRENNQQQQQNGKRRVISIIPSAKKQRSPIQIVEYDPLTERTQFDSQTSEQNDRISFDGPGIMKGGSPESILQHATVINDDFASQHKYNSTLHNFLSEPNPTNLSKILSKEAGDIVKRGSSILDGVKIQSNTAYFVIQNLEQVFPEGASTSFDSESEFYLSLLVASGALPKPYQSAQLNVPVVEILTQVVNVHLPNNQLLA